MKTDLIVITNGPTRTDDSELLLRLIQWLRWKGLRVEILALDVGTRQDIKQSRSIASTTVIGVARSLGPGAMSGLSGGRITRRLRARRLQRWLGRRGSATLLVTHPLAATVVKDQMGHGRHVVAMVSSRNWLPTTLTHEEARAFADIAEWICVDPRQVTSTENRSRKGCHQLDPLLLAEPRAATYDLVGTTPADHARPTVLLAPSTNLWDSADHAIEVAWQLHNKRPDVLIRWISDGRDDRWLSTHDLRHAGLHDVVEQVSSGDPQALSGISVVVRTGYGPDHQGLLLASARAGIPICGMATGRLPTARGEYLPFDVESLVAEIIDLVSEVEATTGFKDGLVEDFFRDFERRSTELLTKLKL